MKIALAQLNPTVGALRENARKISQVIADYSKKAGLIVFPEMVLTGYPPQDLLLDPHFINSAGDALEGIAKKVGQTPVILGTVRGESGKLYNTAAVLQNGTVSDYRDKTLLPTYDVFDEVRYFTPAKSVKPVTLIINGNEMKIGVQICEDLWDDDYRQKVSAELNRQGSELIINISASPFHIQRIDKRLDIVKNKANDLKQYIIYCNLVGAQDELIFDGQSFAVNSHGELMALAKAFEEDILIIDLKNRKFKPPVEICEEEHIFNALSLGVSDYFRKTGHQKAVVGLSGGIDSALTAAIARDALGAENVLGIAMPSQFSSGHSIKDAECLAANMDIPFEIIPIMAINKQMLSELAPVFKESEAGLAEENLQARIRGNILMAAANKLNALLLNTGNKTETALGYCTMYGDMAGALGVISDLNKTQVYAVSRWVNQNASAVIPENTLTKAPSAELKPGQVDPFDYDVVSPLVDILITEPKKIPQLEAEGYNLALVKELLKKIRLAEFKRRQAAPGIRVSTKAFGMGRRYPIVNHFET